MSLIWRVWNERMHYRTAKITCNKCGIRYGFDVQTQQEGLELPNARYADMSKWCG